MAKVKLGNIGDWMGSWMIEYFRGEDRRFQKKYESSWETWVIFFPLLHNHFIIVIGSLECWGVRLGAGERREFWVWMSVYKLLDRKRAKSKSQCFIRLSSSFSSTTFGPSLATNYVYERYIICFKCVYTVCVYTYNNKSN